MKRSIRLFVCAAVFLLLSAQSAFACRAYYASEQRRGLIHDFNDFAYIFDSAGDFYGCAGAAKTKLDAKLSNMLVEDWQSWLSGGSVSYVMAAGLFINLFDGPMPASLDAKIRDVANNYRLVMPKDSTGSVHCGFDNGKWQNGDTCLEDYAMAASAHAWIAAYMRHTGRNWQPARSSAISAMWNMLDPNTTCIRKLDPNAPKDPAGRGPCNGTYNDLIAFPPTGEIVSVNHGEQSVAYGIGQMTSFASATVAMDVMERVFRKSELDGPRLKMAELLFVEGSTRANSDGTFSATKCDRLDVPTVSFVSGRPCWDTTFTHSSLIGRTPYRADMFKMKPLYDRYSISTGSPNEYLFDKFQDVFFSTPTDDPDDHDWAIGRKHFYFTIGSYFVTTKPSMQGRPEYAGGIKRGSYFVAAANNSNVTLSSSTTRSSTSYANITIYDDNGASLRNGDPVRVKNLGGYYWVATGGGGSTVVANGTQGGANQSFTIVKLNETTQMIAHGDRIALKAPNGMYLSAPTIGGNITATATTVGTYETFTLDRKTTD